MFELTQGLFDLVIFDEASQLPLEQAIPAIFRGKRVVVAGDEHQLPPTSFFMTDATSAIETETAQLNEDDADALQYTTAAARAAGIELSLNCEDLLDLSNKILPTHTLTVHYRSRHPALIEFSNWAFYRGNLEAAHPAWGTPTAHTAPIRIHKVNGAYEEQQNVQEARHVVTLLDQLWSEPGDTPSVGVVTFNQKQEELVEDLIARHCSEDHRFRSLYERELQRRDDEQDTGFFVKNLESVQGDERDIIIFSSTFGPTHPGNEATFRRTFGPLTWTGGERRLNVAVTRARDKIIIITSMPFSRISDLVPGTLPPGRPIKARDFLHAYMNYAEAVNIGSADGTYAWLQTVAQLSGASFGTFADTRGTTESPLEEEVFERLTQLGWCVDAQVGEGGFQIDLAVRHPKPELGYILGIECDGKTHHSSWSARTRDVWREGILRNCGWEIERIWSTTWWQNPDSVIAQLHAKLSSRAAQIEQLVPKASTVVVDARMSEDTTVDKPPQLAGEPLQLFGCERVPLPVSVQTLLPNAPQWAESLKSSWKCDVIQEGEIARWDDRSGLQYRLLIERYRGGGHDLRLKCRDETVQHFVLPDNQKPSDELFGRLANVGSHEDMLDWFNWCRRQVYPDE